MRLQTIDKFQPYDGNYVDAYDEPTDNRLLPFKMGKQVKFKDRQDEIVGVVGGFSIINSNVEQVFIQQKGKGAYTRHRVDEIEFMEEMSLKIQPEPEPVKKEKKKISKKVKKIAGKGKSKKRK